MTNPTGVAARSAGSAPPQQPPAGGASGGAQRARAAAPVLQLEESGQTAPAGAQRGGGDASAHRLPFGLSTPPRLDSPESLSTEDIIAIMTALRDLMGKREAQSQKAQITSNNQELQDKHQEKIQKIEDQLAKLKKSKHAGLISKIFKWIGVAVAVIAAIVAVAVLGPAAAPLLVMALVGLSMAIMDETGATEKMIDGIAQGFAKMLEGFGVSKEKAEEVSKYMAVATVMVVMIAANIIASVMAPGAELGETAALIMQATKLIDNAIEASSMAGKAGADVAATTYQYQASEDQASQANIAADIARLGANREQLLASLTRIIKALQEMEDQVPAMLGDIARSEQVLIAQLKPPV